MKVNQADFIEVVRSNPDHYRYTLDDDTTRIAVKVDLASKSDDEIHDMLSDIAEKYETDMIKVTPMEESGDPDVKNSLRYRRKATIWVKLDGLGTLSEVKAPAPAPSSSTPPPTHTPLPSMGNNPFEGFAAYEVNKLNTQIAELKAENKEIKQLAEERRDKIDKLEREIIERDHTINDLNDEIENPAGLQGIAEKNPELAARVIEAAAQSPWLAKVFGVDSGSPKQLGEGAGSKYSDNAKAIAAWYDSQSDSVKQEILTLFGSINDPSTQKVNIEKLQNLLSHVTATA